jgi:hypothetical protein
MKNNSTEIIYDNLKIEEALAQIKEFYIKNKYHKCIRVTK